jgi:uncharacterized protein (DUF952 family)
MIRQKLPSGGTGDEMALIFKIVDGGEWEKARKPGQFTGAAIDLADGYIHLSGADQVKETAQKYFANQKNLVLVAYEANHFGPELKWEISRGGALFPHVYATLDPAKAEWVKPLPWNGAAHDFPEGL